MYLMNENLSTLLKLRAALVADRRVAASARDMPAFRETASLIELVDHAIDDEKQLASLDV